MQAVMRFVHGLAGVALLSAPLIAAAQRGFADGRASAAAIRPAPRTGAPRLRADSTAVRKDGLVLVVAPVAVRGTPGSLEVVGVSVPDSLSGAGLVRYSVTPTGRARVLGNTSGVVAAPAGTDRARVFFTVAAPLGATSGRVQVAMAEFSASGRPTIIVPVEMLVAPTHRVEVALVDRVLGARPGDVIAIRVRSVNFGNVSDVVRIATTVPQGWRVTSGSTEFNVPLAVRGSAESVIKVWVPTGYAAGVAYVRVMASLQGAPVASQDVQVQVGANADGRAAGPGLTVSSVSVASAGMATTTALSASISGALSDSVFVSARGSWMTVGQNSVAQTAFARAGLTDAPPTMELSTPVLRAGAGLTGRSLSELSGNALLGTGGFVELGRERWRGTVVGLRPYAGGFGEDSAAGVIVGARLQHRAGVATYSLSASHIDEPFANRDLDAVSAGVDLKSSPLGQLSSEFGYRRAGDAHGLGVTTELRRENEKSSLTLRVLHAPGGTQGYARATDEVSVAASRQLRHNLEMSTSYWRTGDKSADRTRLYSQGWSAGPRATLPGGHVTLAMTARGMSYAALSRQGGFDNDETQGALSLDVRHGSSYFTSSGTMANVERGTVVAGFKLPTESGRRAEARAALGTGFLGGSLEFNANAVRSDATLGSFPQTSYGVRLDRLSVRMPAGAPVQLAAEIQKANAPWMLAGARSITTSRVSATVPLFAGFGAQLATERNPYLASGTGGRTPWTSTLRLERMTMLPRMVRSHSGRVFHDVDVDGKPDGSERGLRGVVIRCGGESTVTDGQGRYSCPRGGDVQLDPRSIPLGLIAPAMRSGVRASGDIALTSVAAVLVELEVQDVDSSRVSGREMLALQVIARDALGQPWMARRTGNSNAVFDALPPGRYTLDVDVTPVAEPLRLVTANPMFEVRDGRAMKPLRLVLRGREMRIKVIPSAASAAAAAAAAQAAGSNPPKLPRQVP